MSRDVFNVARLCCQFMCILVVKTSLYIVVKDFRKILSANIPSIFMLSNVVCCQFVKYFSFRDFALIPVKLIFNVIVLSCNLSNVVYVIPKINSEIYCRKGGLNTIYEILNYFYIFVFMLM